MVTDDIEVRCPHCGELLELRIEIDVQGELVQDCEVCCRPIRLVVQRDGWGDPEVDVEAIEC